MRLSQRCLSLGAVLLAALAFGSTIPSSSADSAGETHRRKFMGDSPEALRAWQDGTRKFLFDRMHLTDLMDDRSKDLDSIPFEAKVLSSEDKGTYVLEEIELNSTPDRRIKAILTRPKTEGKSAAVVCIHGHGGTRQVVHDPASLYRGFAKDLAERGYVTISTDVGQHEVYEEGRTLMGERLWDLIRCTDYLTTLDQVDADRLGCGGLSLGGEMAMWLGAMDPRMKGTVSSGFLTTVENMQDGHCMCWDFPGFSDNFTFSDIYALIAPRALLCQIGAKEREPGGFPPNLAYRAMDDIQQAYAVGSNGHLATLSIHSDGHVYQSAEGAAFFDKHLQD
ncbi:alpha/beta hydrolase family protein [Aeoliella sp. SH292]|uniref:alpha/beta hydrolase family protein n=1 Tax=Aeoliella sp. SH292 TaxID=3454464 RepID=UPI003F988049